MQMDSRSRWQGKGSLEELMRERIRGTIELIVEQELQEAIGAASSERVGEQRAGYRHGHRARTLSTSLGATTIAMPRARIEGGRRPAAGMAQRDHSELSAAHRTVDEETLGVYLSGTNTRPAIESAHGPVTFSTTMSRFEYSLSTAARYELVWSCSTGHRAKQPRLGHSPIALDRLWRDSQELHGFLVPAP
jgi:hypothetical protein